MVSLNPTEEKTYLGFDAACKLDSNIDLLEDLHTPEFLNGIKCSKVSWVEIESWYSCYVIKKYWSFC